MRSVRMFALCCIFVSCTSLAHAQGIIVDHTSLPLFDQIPEEYLVAAANLPMMFVDRSVGMNINDGLTCLQYESDEVAPTSCKRFRHVLPQFSSPQSEVNWLRRGGYKRSNWVYYTWPGSGFSPQLSCDAGSAYWYRQLECFIRFVEANPVKYTVYSYQFTYLEVTDSSDITARGTGFFARQPNRFDIDDLEAMERTHPWLVLLYHTTNLARSIGTRVATAFNDQLREYVRANNKILLDVADIESHDPSGQPCYDNRDGRLYATGNASENYADDRENLPALCQQYTREIDGGHLGNPDVGKIRLAKAYWIAMARIVGWKPPSPASPLRSPNVVR